MRPVTRAVALVAVACVVTGCASEASEILETDSGNIVVVSTRTPTAFPQAEIRGSLVWSDAGCLSLSADWGDFLLVLPAGSVALDDDSVRLDDGTEQRVGTTVAWGGGYYSPYDADSGTIMTMLAEVPSGCITDEVAIVNPLSSH